MQQMITFISLGPGNSELVTLKAYKLLQQADLIFCPGTTTSSGRVMSRAKSLLTELDIAPSKINVFDVPMSARREAALLAYEQTATHILQHYNEGKQIAVTVEGDASIYASIHYMMDFFTKRGIPISQSCGIPSFIAATEPGCLQLTAQDQRLVILPGDFEENEINRYLSTRHTVVVMKLSKCETAAKEFIAAHPQYHYHYVENISMTEREQYLTRPNEIVERDFPYFSLLIIQSETHKQ